MKKMMLVSMLLFLVKVSPAQTFSEWFRQKATQKKYLIEQIAALKIYSDYLKAGYDIGKKGLTTIGNIKNGDFNLHRDFFGSLSVVNPAIKHYARVSDIIAMQVSILSIRDKTISQLGNSEVATTNDKEYTRQVFTRLMEDCGNLMDELGDVALQSTLTLKDDERLQRIDELYKAMLSNYRFANHFNGQILALLYSKQQEHREAITTKTLYGIK